MAYQGIRSIFVPLVRSKIQSVMGKENLPEKLPFILAANHVGYLDAPALTTFVLDNYNLPVFFITTPHIWRPLGKKIAINWLGMIPLEKGKQRDSLEHAIRMVKAGNMMGIFPEGTRNDNLDSLLKGKTGAVRLALATGTPLIPVGIFNNTGYHFSTVLKNIWQRSKFVTLKFGPPVNLDEFKNRTIDKPLLEMATRRLMLAISQLCGKSYLY